VAIKIEFQKEYSMNVIKANLSDYWEKVQDLPALMILRI
jgi:hypothetical protein